jgi:hypothetical protein
MGLVLGSLASPAFADAPSDWESTDNPSTLNVVLLLVGGPLLIIALITLLTYLPSMIKAQSGSSTLTFEENPEWFGGPRQGSEPGAASEAETTTKGGASANW